jgi:flagellar secretion chaperone FliS
MSASQNSSYLESKVLTASPQRLHLMLVEGAQRFGRQAEDALLRGDAPVASIALMRVLDIVGELLAGVREKKSELNTKLAEFYWFLFRRVSLAKINGDAAILAEVLRLLEFERQTWQLVCDKLDGSPTGLPTQLRPPHTQLLLRATKAGFALEA